MRIVTPEVIDQLRSVAFLLQQVANALEKANVEGPFSCDACHQRVKADAEMRVYHAACNPKGGS